MKSLIDPDFLRSLSLPFLSVEDERVAKGMASMLKRKLFVITSDVSGPKTQLYRPFSVHINEHVLALGHIRDHHFVPLEKKVTFPKII